MHRPYFQIKPSLRFHADRSLGEERHCSTQNGIPFYICGRREESTLLPTGQVFGYLERALLFIDSLPYPTSYGQGVSCLCYTCPIQSGHTDRAPGSSQFPGNSLSIQGALLWTPFYLPVSSPEDGASTTPQQILFSTCGQIQTAYSDL